MAQVADYDIANASGASVRSDLNAVFEAIKTLNSGGTDPANPLAFMPYVDTADNNNLKIRNASNNGFTTVGSVNDANLGLLPKSGGIMTGQIQGAAGGGAGIPEYSFVTDTDTGMFRSGANQVAFTCAGTKISHYSSAGLFLTSTGSATTGLFLNDADNTAHISLKAPDTLSSSVTYKLPGTIVNGGFMQTDASGNLSFQIVAGVPTGSVFCMAVATVPSGYLECNGQTLSRTTYAALFNIIGTQYGAPSGSTFKVPDLRGEFIRGFDNGRGVDNSRSIGTLQGDDNKLHNHGINFNTQSHSLTGTVGAISETFEVSGTTTGVFSKGSVGGQRTPIESDVSGAGSFNFNGTHSHSVVGNTANSGGDGIQGESRPRNIAMMYVIKI
tara:strand:+ start:1676 stop:2830 length:1155 start_codon:yes stop_codon:yes gene_type:complete